MFRSILFMATVFLAIAARPSMAIAGNNDGDDDDVGLLALFSPDPVEAAADFAKGKDLARVGKFKEARIEFFKANWYDDRPEYAANLGTIEVALKRYRDAVEHLTWALDRFPAETPAAKRNEVSQTLRQAQSELGVVRLHVDATRPRDFSVEIFPAGEASWFWVGIQITDSIYINPGHSALKVTTPKGDAEIELDVAKGEIHDVTLELKPYPAANGVQQRPPPPPPVARPATPKQAQSDASRVRRIRDGFMVGFGALAATGAAVGTAGVVLGLQKSRDDQLTYAAMAAGGFGGAADALLDMLITHTIAHDELARLHVTPAIGVDQRGLTAIATF